MSIRRELLDDLNQRRNTAEQGGGAERIEKRHNKARANSLLAVKLGRAVYWMWTRKTAFDPNIFLK